MSTGVIDTHRFKGTFFFPANDGKKAGLWEQCFCGYQGDYPAHVQAELVRASTVTTEAELNALPEGTLIESGTFILRHRRRIKQWQQVMRIDGEPCHPYDMEPADVPVPATVLFRPV